MKECMALFLVLLIIPMAFAQEIGVTPETTETVEAAAGITPDNQLLYWLDELGDGIKVAMATKGSDKVKARLEIAEEKLAEYQLMQEKGKTTAAAKSLQRHNEQVAGADAEPLAAEEKTRVQENFYKHIQVLERVRAKIRARNPDQAQGLDTTLVNSYTRMEQLRASLPEEQVKTDEELETEAGPEMARSWAEKVPEIESDKTMRR